MASVVKYGHASGLKVGWYENGCACGERHALMQNYEGDVRSLHDYGFDGVKLDGCGAQRNMTLYAQLMKDTGKAYLIENCHWGRLGLGIGIGLRLGFGLGRSATSKATPKLCLPSTLLTSRDAY